MSNKTSEDRIKVYLSKLKKYKNKVLSKKILQGIIEGSDISDNDIENIGLHFKRSYEKVKKLVELNQLDVALRELKSIYLYSIHDKSMFNLFFLLFEKLADKINTKEIKKKMIHLRLQAREFGMKNDIDLIDYYESSRLKSGVLILILSTILALIISFVIYKFVRYFIESEKNSSPDNKDILVQGLPSITRASNLMVESANLLSNSSNPYYVEVESAKVLVFEDSHAYQVKAGLISKVNPVKKISYRITIYDDLEQSVFSETFEKESDFPAKWNKYVYIPIDAIVNIPKSINSHPKKMVLDILELSFFENFDETISSKIDSNSSTLEFRYIGNYFKKSFGIFELNTVIEVFNSSKNKIKNLELEVNYIDMYGRIIRSLRRKLISDANSSLKSQYKQNFTISTIFPKEIYPTIEKDFLSIRIDNVLIK